MDKIKVITAAGVGMFFVMGSVQIAKASVNSNPYEQMQRDWGETVRELHPVNTYPDLYRPFDSTNEAYNAVHKYAYNDQSSVLNDQGFYPVSQTVTLDGDPVQTENNVSVSGSETLTNVNLATTNLLTNATKFTVSNGTTITTNNAFNLGVSSASTFEIPFAKNTTTVTASYNYGHTDAQSNNTSVEYDIPSQSIPVKPGHTVAVDYVMTLGKASGSLNINGQMSGTSPFFMQYKHGSFVPAGFTGLGTLMTEAGASNYNKFSVISPDTVSYTGGKAQYTSSYYSNMSLRVKDITSGETNFYKVNNAKNFSKISSENH
ncbi:ETX/MTX2 family pore-forming toxin [Lactiplantibacillus plantarum]